MSGNDTTTAKDRAIFFSKMSRITGEVISLKKSSTNSFHKYKYTGAEKVLEALAPLLAKENIALISETVWVVVDDKVYMPHYVFTFVCGDTGYMHACSWYGETVHTSNKGVRDDKALNKSATISQKYFLLKTFLIATDDDPDGAQGDTQQSNGKSTIAPPQKKPTTGPKEWNKDYGQVTAFVEWCKTAMIDYSNAAMLKALNDALATPLPQFGSMKQYPGDKIHAMDAIIAYECGYMDNSITTITERILKEVSPEAFELHVKAVKMVCDRVNDRVVM